MLDRSRLAYAEDHWQWTEAELALTTPRDRVTRAVVDLLTSPEVAALHQCEDAACGWVYLDTSPRRNRRWCRRRRLRQPQPRPPLLRPQRGGPIDSSHAPQQVQGVIARSKDAPVERVTINVPDPGPGEAVVKVLACGVCHTDLHYVQGGIGDDYPYLLGHEAAGTVESVGEGVRDLAPGDYVILNWRGGLRQLPGLQARAGRGTASPPSTRPRR